MEGSLPRAAKKEKKIRNNKKQLVNFLQSKVITIQLIQI